MAKNSFQVLETVQLTSGGVATLSYQVSSGRRFTIFSVLFASDGSFNITDIRSSRGSDFSNVSSVKPLPSTMVGLTTNNNNTPQFPHEAIVLEGGDIFSVSFADTSSAANDVWMLLNGVMEDV